jgi:hypothetical protein
MSFGGIHLQPPLYPRNRKAVTEEFLRVGPPMKMDENREECIAKLERQLADYAKKIAERKSGG